MRRIAVVLSTSSWIFLCALASDTAPLTLERVLSLVDAQAPDVLVADAQVEVSSAGVERAEAARLPRVGLSSTFSPGAQVTVPLYPSAAADRSALCSAGNLACSAGAAPVGSARANTSIDARWRLFDFGVNDSVVASREHALEAERSRSRSTRAQAAATALKRWLLVLADDELVGVRRRLADDRTRQAEVVRARVEIGEVSPTDAIQTEVAAQAAALELSAAEAAARADRIPLAVSLGLEPTAPLSLSGSLLLTVDAPKGLTHPDQAVVEAAVRAADSEQRAADRSRWPALDGTASLGAGAVGTVPLGTVDPVANVTPQAGVGVLLEWPLIDFGVFADQRIAAANLALAQRRRALEVQRIEGERQRAVIAYQGARGLRERAAQLVESARAALVAVEGRYAAGAARIAELLEAQTALAQAELVHVQARLSAAQAAVDVALAHGAVDATAIRVQPAHPPAGAPYSGDQLR